jgi:hypothetical protein
MSAFGYLVHVTVASVSCDLSWAKVVERLLGGVAHSDYLGALLLITLGFLSVMGLALWTVQMAIKALSVRRRK